MYVLESTGDRFDSPQDGLLAKGLTYPSIRGIKDDKGKKTLRTMTQKSYKYTSLKLSCKV